MVSGSDAPLNVNSLGLSRLHGGADARHRTDVSPHNPRRRLVSLIRLGRPQPHNPPPRRYPRLQLQNPQTRQQSEPRRPRPTRIHDGDRLVHQLEQRLVPTNLLIRALKGRLGDIVRP